LSKTKKLKRNINIVLIILTVFSIVGCNLTKQLPKDKYLLKKNRIYLSSFDIDYDAIDAIVRQHPNRKFLGVKWRALIYNLIDSANVADKRARKNQKIRSKNAQKLYRQDKINQIRIAKAIKKGDSTYIKKQIELKDTIEPSLFLREWIKFKIGENPVIFDSLIFQKTNEQILAYLKKKGYYFAELDSKVRYKKNRKAIVTYNIQLNECYIIDSIYVVSENPVLISSYKEFMNQNSNLLKSQPFDVDLLENFQSTLSKYLRDQAIYGFLSSYVTFEIDTLENEKRVNVGVILNDKKILESSTNQNQTFSKSSVENIYFHIQDTSYMKGRYQAILDSLFLEKKGNYYPSLDTLYFNEVTYRNSKEVNPNRAVYFLYNGELLVDPIILESQTLIEKDRFLNENLVEETFLKLNFLGLFHTVKIEVEPTTSSDFYNVHYYLYPAKKESFSFQPRVTTSNGFLGVSAGLNYNNKNLFRGAERLTLSMNGGFQSQPLIFEETNTSNDLIDVTNRFYQFEVSPSVKLELPGLLLIKNSKSNKSRNGKTIVSSAFGYQKRDVFSKEIFQLNYTWIYSVNKTQQFQMGLPVLSQVKFVSINKSDKFQSQLTELNDPFLINTYSNQFIWQDWSFQFEYRSKLKDKENYQPSVYYRSNLDFAGNFLKLFRSYQVQDTTGQNKGANRLLGLVYSQFGRLDNELILTKPITKTKSLNFRILAGAGIPYGNSKTSMPYDYSFYAGGANDVRGWRARSLGPGGYKYYLDTSRTIVQVGDVRLVASAEYRFQFSDFLKGALFMDAGNIWTVREDNNRNNSKISKDWIRQIGVSGGIGFRMDFEYFLLRFDLGFKLHNPALPNGEKWVFQSREKFNQEINNFIVQAESNGNNVTMSKLITKPFTPQISFGIGYPF